MVSFYLTYPSLLEMVCRGTITDLFDVTQWFSEMLFYSNMRFLKSGYSCHLLTIELISERGYEVKFPLLLFRLESREGEQNDGLNALLFKTEKATNPWVPQQRASGSEVTPKFLQCLHISVVLFSMLRLFPNANAAPREELSCTYGWSWAQLYFTS